MRSNGDSHIEGFMRGNTVSHKFKFIEKTSQISDHRGDKISDGLIRITFQFEKRIPEPTWHSGVVRTPNSFGGGFRGQSIGGGYSNHIYSSSNTPMAKGLDSIQCSYKPVSDDGITVKGSSSNQTFTTTTVGILEDTEHVIVFQLKGETGKGRIEQPILIKTKIKCDTCGTLGLSRQKFCSNCGTSLVI
ncbi:MAG: hypothetical protein KAS32_22005 [Candidatus Peribacteraceae bacterium]|nr:hypothetical protein [Candidatus Peribacteraceae bacterium]